MRTACGCGPPGDADPGSADRSADTGSPTPSPVPLSHADRRAPGRADLDFEGPDAPAGAGAAFEPHAFADPPFAHLSSLGEFRRQPFADGLATRSSESRSQLGAHAAACSPERRSHLDPDGAACPSDCPSQLDPDAAARSSERRSNFDSHTTPGADRDENFPAKASSHRDADLDYFLDPRGGAGAAGIFHADSRASKPGADELPHTVRAAGHFPVACGSLPGTIAASGLLGFPSRDGRAPNRR